MPYLRPDRKGLPDPPASDEEDSSIPRSESYLRLHGLDTSQASRVSQSSPSNANPEMEPSKSRRTSMSKPAEMTPLVEFSSASAQSPEQEESSNSRPTTASRQQSSATGRDSIGSGGGNENGHGLFSDVLVESPFATSMAERSPRSSLVMSPKATSPKVSSMSNEYCLTLGT